MDRRRAHLIVVTHQPERIWYTLWLRLRCRHCAQRYPCPPRLGALDHLTAGHDDERPAYRPGLAGPR